MLTETASLDTKRIGADAAPPLRGHCPFVDAQHVIDEI
jgi:hypothetical protein